MVNGGTVLSTFGTNYAVVDEELPIEKLAGPQYVIVKSKFLHYKELSFCKYGCWLVDSGGLVFTKSTRVELCRSLLSLISTQNLAACKKYFKRENR
jgi:hypothetical protein